MNLNQLYYFQMVARLQHFTQAAEMLHVTQPSVSYAIHSLQDELGVKLFQDHGRRVELTKYGQIFLEYVEKSLGELDRGIQHVQKLTGEQEGRIDIGYVFPLASYYIPHMVRRFLNIEGNRSKQFTYYQGNTSVLIDGLKHQKFDVVFGSYQSDEPELEFYPLIKQDLKLIVPPEHPLAGHASVELSEMLPYPMIFYNDDGGLGRTTREIFTEAGIQPNIVSQASNELALYGLVAENLGISLAADIREIKQFNVKAVPVNHPKCTRYVYMVYLKDHYLSPAVHSFLQYMKAHVQDIG